jgi:hypothetical protein
VLVLCFSLLGCGSQTKHLDAMAVERGVAASILAQHHLYAVVKCPSHVPQQAGRMFTCTARFAVGIYSIPVTEVDDRGNVRWATTKPLVGLDVARVKRAIRLSIRRKRALDVAVRCPADVLQKAGLAFTCTASVHGHSYPFTVTEVDDRGHVRYVGR